MQKCKKISKTTKTRELLGELVRMWQQAGKSRAGAIDQSSKDLGISARKGKCILYDEPHILTDLEALGAECRAENAWLRIADTARQTAEYCEAQAELSRIRKRQGDLFERGVGCSKFTRSLRKSPQHSPAEPRTNTPASNVHSGRFGIGSKGLLCAAGFAPLCAMLIG